MNKRKLGLFFTSLSLSIGAFSFAIFSNATQAKENVVTFATYTNGDAATYYNSIDSTKSGNDLLTDLRTLNLSKRQSTVGYSSMGTDPSGMFKYTDYDTNYVQYDSNGQPYGTRISSFYTYTSATSWNREHVWPNSHGGGNGGDAGSPYPDADIHMPRPTISSENSSRGNSFYVEGMNHSSSGWDPYTAGYSAESRGEAARITFYCTLVNSKLILAPSNTTPSGKDSVTGQTFGSGHTMGNLETLIKWNINYPVTQREKNRNEGAEYLQGNRNAFVDHPEYACRIWGNVNSTIKSMCDSASWSTGPSVSISKTQASIVVDDTTTISATASDSSAITWSSSDETVVEVSQTNSSSGTNVTLTGIGPGTATVTATATINSTVYTATCSVTVSSSGGSGGGDTPVSDSYTITNTDVPSSYPTTATEYTAASGLKFYGFNVMNQSSKVQFKKNGGYIYNSDSLDLGTLTLAGVSGTLTVYAGTTRNPSSTTISGTNGVYNLNGYNYFKIINSSGSVSSCSSITVGIAQQQEKELSSISVSTAPTKTTYTAGEYFDPTGLVITRTYSDSTSDTYTYSGHTSEFSFSPSTSTALTTSNTSVTITYGGKSCNQTIIVNAPVTLSSIAVSNPKTSYFVGDSFVKPTVTATYSDNTQADVTSSATFSGYNLSNAGNQTVTVSYTEGGINKTTSYQITVTAVALSSISVSGQKTSYYVGDTFEKPTVTATFNNNTQTNVTSSATFSGYNLSTAGNQTVTVSYTYQGVTKTTSYQITVTAVTLSSIAVTSDITNKNQTVGSTFSSDGLVVTASYNNGSSKDVTSSCTITAPDMTTTGQKTVNISYTEGGVTRYTSTTINVVAVPTASYYQKVTTTSEIESGQYLIVYESGNVAFNGGLSAFDAASNTIGVTINNGQIESNSTTNAAAFTIDKATGALQGASGKYAGVNSYSNGLVSSNTVIANSFAIENNAAKITVTTTGGTMTLKYNDASDQKRFRYYKSGQKDIQLYKLVASSGGGGEDEPTLTSISLELNDVGTYFELGSEFSYEGLIVHAHYSDNTSVPITDYTVSTPDMNTLGQQEVTVTYQGQTAKYTIEVFTEEEEPLEYSLTVGSPYMNGVPYKMFFDNKSDSNPYYFTGEMSGYYGATSTTSTDGVDVYFEQGESGQYLYFKEGYTKQYISIVLNGSYYNFAYGTSKPTTEWVYSSTYECLVFYFDETPYTVGSYDTNTRFGATNLSKHTDNYNVQFITKNDEGAVPFATIMNEYITCDSTGAKGPTFQEGFDWDSFKEVFKTLDDDSRATLKSTNPSNEEVAEFVTRYDYIVGKYGTGTYSDFLGRNPSPISSKLNANFDLEESNSMFIIVLVATGISFLSLTLLLIKKKKRR